MMNREQYLLTKLAEECAEVAQMALKTQQFGQEEHYPESRFNNKQRLNLEYNDLLTIIGMLNEEFNYNLKQDFNLISKKKNKLDYYHTYAVNLGMVTDE